jgi:GT2 family glycosyltransferase
VLSPCLESFRREAEAAGFDAESIAVEHSEDAAELARVKAAGVDRLIERPNRGYAAGLNAGAAEARGDVVLLANPDIVFFPGSLGALVDGVSRGFDVVGPRFVWDEDGAVLLPDAEDPSPRAELGRALRRRSPTIWRTTLNRSLDRASSLWTAGETLPVACLRGALLAVTPDTLARYGPFDEGYCLYDEETEWLWRARRRGARIGLAAGATVQHRWGHATGQSDGAAELEQASRRRFAARNYGGLWRRVLRAGGGGHRRDPMEITRLTDDEAVPAVENELWLASPFPHLMPALGSVGSAAMPPAFLDFCRAWRWFVVSAAREGADWKITGAWTWGG